LKTQASLFYENALTYDELLSVMKKEKNFTGT